MSGAFSFEPAKQLLRAFTHPIDGFPDYDFISPVRWFQFWRWRLIRTRDYILSRASEIILTERMAATMQKELDAVKPMSEKVANVNYLFDHGLLIPSPLPPQQGGQIHNVDLPDDPKE